MSLKTRIIGRKRGIQADVDSTKGEQYGVVVATRPLKTFDNKILFFANDTFGTDLNQNAGIGDSAGLIEIVYAENAGIATEWDTSAITGGARWDFASADQSFAGSVSIDGTSTINDNVMQLADASLFDLDGFSGLTIFIYITGWSNNGTKDITISGWNTSTSFIVGNSVNIGDFADTGSLNTWQEIFIPLSSMGLVSQSIDALRFTVIDTGGGPAPNFFLDNIQFESQLGGDNAGPTEFVVQPDLGTWLHITNLHIIMVDIYDSTVANGTMLSLPYDGFLGLGELQRGVQYQIINNGEIKFHAVIRKMFDFMQLPSAEITGQGSDGTNSWFTAKITFSTPLVLKSENLDKLSLTINDDLSLLLEFRTSVMA
ncbi:hypothetical protein LCGC14_1271640, partial [marine sediment metagenome]